jgi:hypothetical protein
LRGQAKMRLTVILALTLIGTAAMGPRPAAACKVISPQPFDIRSGSTDLPPKVEIKSLTVSLGKNFGKAGPGDCSDLGSVDIELATADGSPLDGRFGAEIDVIAGELPVLQDLGSWLAPIENNRITLTLMGDQPSVDFSVAVRVVNASGAPGEPSAPVHRSAQAGGGCQVGGRASGGLSFASLFALFGLAALLRRLAAPGDPRSPMASYMQQESK